MKWPRTSSGWDRSAKLLAAFVATVTAAGALTPFIGWVAFPIVIAAIAVIGALWGLAIAIKKAGVEEAREEAQLDRRLLVRIQRVGSVDPRKIGIDRATQNVLPGGEVPEYLPRTKDHAVQQALQEAFYEGNRWIVVVCGPSKTGKSRLLFEALRWLDKEHEIHLVSPKDGAAVKSLREPGQLPRDLAGKKLVVWLDDLETFVAAGVDFGALQEWHERSGVIFAATYGGKGSERLREQNQADLTVLTETVLQHAAQTGLAKTDAAELKQLPVAVTPLIKQEMERHGLPAIMVSGPSLERKLVTGRHAPGEAECLSGVSIVRAAADWARCGRTDPIPAALLQRLWKNYLPSGAQVSESAFQEGLQWALRPVSGTIALLQEVDGLLPYDYIVRFVEIEERGAPREVAWTAALEDVEPGQAFSVGVRANLFGRQTDAEAAMQIASEAADERLAAAASHNLGVLLKEAGEIDKAEEAFRRADEGGLGISASNLGFLLEEKGDSAAAKAAFERAAERGNSGGAFNLGLMFLKSGDSDSAVAAFELAEELGDSDAPNNLAVLLLDAKGDTGGAEAAFRRAAERGNAEGAYNLGLLLKGKDQYEAARAAFHQAAQGDDDRIAKLAEAELARLANGDTGGSATG